MKNYKVLSSGWLESVVLICSSLLIAQLFAAKLLPGWWNWQTRRSQKPVLERGCWFKSSLGHQKFLIASI